MRGDGRIFGAHCARAPDLIRQTDPQSLSTADREVLARYGWLAAGTLPSGIT